MRIGSPRGRDFFPLPDPECCFGHPASNLGDFVFLLRNSPVCSDGHSGAIFGTLTFGTMTFGTIDTRDNDFRDIARCSFSSSRIPRCGHIHTHTACVVFFFLGRNSSVWADVDSLRGSFNSFFFLQNFAVWDFGVTVSDLFFLPPPKISGVVSGPGVGPTPPWARLVLSLIHI